ncbi:hypothetical protein QEH59_15520 [Coraliomargarita sp. SDUM461004]|uniref:DUF1579 domain-containing protein n=1 Tax=Thalassobacterium sedimentorum TaxID=3041258 RepID=A0ABU1AM14_9BACT|nr:hypothetical protein [Coraliomargarita sp. SDUM461004]MDQ8195842.1 hypothetical protein [Coraliomargarita sp. SDUM461004]
MSRYLTTCFLLFMTALALPADEVVDYLKRYTGRWVGDFTIHSTATGYSETFPVEQRYWLEDGQLHGIAVSETDHGMQVAKSRTYIQHGELRSEVTQGKVIEQFMGVLHDAGIVWLPADRKRVTDYQMKEEFVVQETGEAWLHTDGFDSYVYQDGLAHLVYRGRLVKQVD